nr:DUF4747 family protein [Stenotrophomonas geniculata]
MGRDQRGLDAHPPGAYERLFRLVYHSRIKAPIFGGKWGIFSALDLIKGKDGEVSGLSGVISTFTKLDKDLPWFNEDTSKAASDDDLGELVVPDHLQPNHQRCSFYFDIRRHVLVFETLSRKGGVSPRLMRDFLNRVLMSKEVTSKMSPPVLSVIPDTDAVDAILGWKKIKKLTIHATRPNPGDYDEEDLAQFEESLIEQNASSVDVILSAEEHSFLAPNDTTRTLMSISADNGFVVAKGQDEQGRPMTLTTKNKAPFWQREYFDPDREIFGYAFVRMAQNAVRSIVERRLRSKA